MIKNAYLYEEEIKKALYKTWYEPKYEFYYAGGYHSEFILNHTEDGDYCNRSFVSVDANDNLLGLIRYPINHDTRSANNLSIISFTDKPTLIFGKDVIKAIDDIFTVYGLNRLGWFCIIGNHTEKRYDKFCLENGGRIIGVQRQVVQGRNGQLYDEKLYEIIREDYLKAKCKSGNLNPT